MKTLAIICLFLIISSSICKKGKKEDNKDARRARDIFLSEDDKFDQLKALFDNPKDVGEKLDGLKKSDIFKNWSQFLNDHQDEAQPWIVKAKELAQSDPVKDLINNGKFDQDVFIGDRAIIRDLINNDVGPAVTDFVHKHKDELAGFVREAKPEVEEFIHKHGEQLGEYEKEAKDAFENYVEEHKGKSRNFFEDEVKPAVTEYVHNHQGDARGLVTDAKPAVEEFIHKHQDEARDFFENDFQPAVKDFVHEHKDEARDFFEKDVKPAVEEFVHKHGDEYEQFYEKEAKPAIDEFVHNHHNQIDELQKYEPLVDKWFADEKEEAKRFFGGIDN
jgi:hypothetical protein